MQTNSDVNPVFQEWRSSTGLEKEEKLRQLLPLLERYATNICWERLPDYQNDFGPLVNGIVWRAIKKADKFEDRAKFSTWFYKIAVNECNTFLRRAKESMEDRVEDMEVYSGRAPSLDARLDLIAALDALEGSEHTLLRMIAEGQNLKTIAKNLGIGYEATKVRWFRLREKLRDALGQ